MALITVDIIVDRLEDVLQNFDRIKVYRSTTGVSGPFTEITAGPPANTRIPLVPGTVVYNFDDPTGDAAYYYTVSYFNSTTLAESSQSEPQPGARDTALDVISVDELKNIYLFGVDLTNDAGEEYPTILFEWYIKSAVRWLETKLDINITPHIYTAEKHDFYREDYYRHIFLKVDHVPILNEDAVDRIQLILPTNQPIIDFNKEWFNVVPESGQINIIPGNTQTSTIVLGAGGQWLPFIYNTAKFIPNAFHIDYTAGWAKGAVPAEIRHAVGMVASYGPLNIAGDLLGGAGIASQSISLDGLSQSFNTTSSATNAGYGARILQYSKELKDMLPQLRRKYHPVGLEVV